MANHPLPSPPPVDALPAVPSLRTLGTGSQQACAGDDPRLDSPQYITVAFTSCPGTYVSTSALPNNSVVVRSTVRITTPYLAGTDIKVTAGAVTLQWTTDGDNVPTAANQYDVTDVIDITVGAVITVAITGSAYAGAGYVMVEYTVPRT